MQMEYAVIGAGGLAVLAYEWMHADDARASAVPVPQKQPVDGANRSGPVGAKMAGRVLPNGRPAIAHGGLNTVGGQGGLKNAAPGFTPSALLVGGSMSEVAVRQSLRQLEAEAKRLYDGLGDTAKNSAAQTLNGYMKPSPGLTGHESWEEAGKKVGAAIGASAGAATCAAIPIPGLNAIAAATVCATLGAMIGAYLGDKLGGWAKGVYNDVKEWAQKQWNKAQDEAVKIGHEIEDKASDAYHAVANFVGDIW